MHPTKSQFRIFSTPIFLTLLLLAIQISDQPAAAQDEPQRIRFAAIGDFGDDSIESRYVSNRVNSWNVDFIITLGDNRYSDKTYDRTVGKHYCSHLTEIPTATNCAYRFEPANSFFPSPGNHDYYDGKGRGIDEYLDYFVLPGNGIATTNTSGSELYYDFIQGPVHFFVLDSEAAKRSSVNRAEQQDWLETQLKASTTPWQLVYMHHPPYSSGRHGSNEFIQWDFAAWGADAVLSAHDHTYERLRVDGLPYFVNGLGGKSIYNFNSPVPGSEFRYNRNYGAMLISATDDQISFQFINHGGRTVDTFAWFADPIATYLPAVIKP